MYGRRRKCWVMIPPRHSLPCLKRLGQTPRNQYPDGRVTASPQLKTSPPQSVGRPARHLKQRDAKYRTDQQPGDELRLVSHQLCNAATAQPRGKAPTAIATSDFQFTKWDQ